MTLKASIRHLRIVRPLSRPLWPGGNGPWSVATLEVAKIHPWVISGMKGERLRGGKTIEKVGDDVGDGKEK